MPADGLAAVLIGGYLAFGARVTRRGRRLAGWFLLHGVHKIYAARQQQQARQELLTLLAAHASRGGAT